MKRNLFITAIIIVVFPAFKTTAQASKPGPADVIVQWNLITVKATKIGKQNSNLASRTEAIEAIAVYDAVNSIKHFGTPYHYFVKPERPASAQAAAAQGLPTMCW